MHTQLHRPLFLPKAKVGRISLAVAASLLIALCAQITLPLQPVPITLQSFAVILCGFIFGAETAVLAVSCYLLEGALGLPVLADFCGGIHYFFGPTTGYLLGFIPAAYVSGKLMEHGLCRRRITIALSFIACCFCIYFPGVSALSLFIGLKQAIALGFTPFIAPALAKMLLICAITPFCWKQA